MMVTLNPRERDTFCWAVVKIQAFKRVLGGGPDLRPYCFWRLQIKRQRRSYISLKKKLIRDYYYYYLFFSKLWILFRPH